MSLSGALHPKGGEGGRAGVGAKGGEGGGWGLMSESDQASVVCMPLVSPHYLSLHPSLAL